MNSFSFGKSLFWDVNEQQMNLFTRKEFIIQRVFVRGGMKDVKTVISLYSRNEIVEALKKSQELDRVTHNFCSNYFNIPKEEMHAPCEFYR